MVKANVGVLYSMLNQITEDEYSLMSAFSEVAALASPNFLSPSTEISDLLAGFGAAFFKRDSVFTSHGCEISAQLSLLRGYFLG